MMNKKGFSPAYAWIFGLVTLFGLGVLYITFNQVFEVHLVPTIIDTLNETPVDVPESTKTEVENNIEQYMDFFHAMPYILFGVVVIYLFVVAIRKEGESTYK